MKQEEMNFTSFSEEKIIRKHMELLKNNQVPKNSKGRVLNNLGDNINNLLYDLSSDELLNEFLDALILNNTFRGNLVIQSKFFNDIVKEN